MARHLFSKYTTRIVVWNSFVFLFASGQNQLATVNINWICESCGRNDEREQQLSRINGISEKKTLKIRSHKNIFYDDLKSSNIQAHHGSSLATVLQILHIFRFYTFYLTEAWDVFLFFDLEKYVSFSNSK